MIHIICSEKGTRSRYKVGPKLPNSLETINQNNVGIYQNKVSHRNSILDNQTKPIVFFVSTDANGARNRSHERNSLYCKISNDEFLILHQNIQGLVVNWIY